MFGSYEQAISILKQLKESNIQCVYGENMGLDKAISVLEKAWAEAEAEYVADRENWDRDHVPSDEQWLIY